MIRAAVPESSLRCMIAADLHLDGTARREIGLRRLLDAAQDRDADLFLLGDVFHYWFGRKHLSTAMYDRELDLLLEATRAGARIWLVPGNRDFLVEQDFERRTGVRVAGDTLDLEIDGERIHLSHGDLFSTSDVAYQRMRRLLRHRMVVFLAHRLPTPVVRAVATRLREHSAHVVAEKPAEVLQPDLAAVTEVLTRGYQTVVCGHFHECRDERLSTANGGGRFIILEPYEEHGFVMTRDDRGWGSTRLESFRG
jgi:UDP-2,3-diacylglucosamine hydrolase